MKNFKQILSETKGPNKHLTHLEDTFLDWDISGLDSSINFLEEIGNKLAGHGSKQLISTKFDGSPALICGIHPETKKFFVGTKSVFNKVPKINYTDKDIDENHSGALTDILKQCLKYLSKLNIKKIYQGDLLFIPEYKKSKTIDGIDYVTFQPNTIMYAIPQDTELAQKINTAKLGIVFHTEYQGPLENPTTKYNIDISNLKTSKDVWFTDAYFKDISGNINFTKTETQDYFKQISDLKSLISKLNKSQAEKLLSETELVGLIKIFNNSRVREGEFITNPEQHIKLLIDWLLSKFAKDAEKVSTEKAKALKIDKGNLLIKLVEDSTKVLVALFNIQKTIFDIKSIVIKKLEAGKHMDSFVQKEDGFEFVGPEGFVAVDNIGNAVKLVDRLVFSTNNFNAIKNWD